MTKRRNQSDVQYTNRRSNNAVLLYILEKFVSYYKILFVRKCIIIIGNGENSVF